MLAAQRPYKRRRCQSLNAGAAQNLQRGIICGWLLIYGNISHSSLSPTLGFTATTPAQSNTKTRAQKMTRSKSESKAAEDEGWTSASSTNETPEKSPSESPRLTQSQSQPDLSSLPGQLKRLNLVNVGGNGCNVEDPEESDVNTPKPSSSYSFTNVPPRPSSITSTTSSKAPPSVFKMSSPLAQVDTKTVAHAADSPTNTSTTNLQDNLAAKLGYKSSLGAISRQNIGTPALRTPPAKSHLVISNFTPAGSQDLPPTPTYSRLTTYSNLKSSHTALRTFFHPQKDSLERCGRYGKFDPPPKWFEPVKNNHHPFFHPRKPNQLRNLPRPKSMHPESTPKLSPGSTRSSFGQAISGVVSKNPINRVFSYND